MRRQKPVQIVVHQPPRSPAGGSLGEESQCKNENKNSETTHTKATLSKSSPIVMASPLITYEAVKYSKTLVCKLYLHSSGYPSISGVSTIYRMTWSFLNASARHAAASLYSAMLIALTEAVGAATPVAWTTAVIFGFDGSLDSARVESVVTNAMIAGVVVMLCIVNHDLVLENGKPIRYAGIGLGRPGQVTSINPRKVRSRHGYNPKGKAQTGAGCPDINRHQ